ncbi:hypothetical protein I2485_02620 [Nesterenkonia sp. E16_7]|uniref:hypothetical protein n=1 Tax=unclassified Nesterenkonia TaxID=2629769 RepID=UPI001A9246C0|nr:MULTISPECIES: hypothetical protein [unclassified Nesterenkonia]MBO0594094.1 hypothetical protein [Nesterenkonia sp. E16_10]MBO0597540.1 hypothetical protein [Nesterenkonia sp. E16_7]
MATKHLLTKTPRTVLYAIGGVAILVLVGAVVAELLEPGSVQQIRQATETVVVEIGLVAAALAALVPHALAVLNLSDDEPKPVTEIPAALGD